MRNAKEDRVTTMAAINRNRYCSINFRTTPATRQPIERCLKNTCMSTIPSQQTVRWNSFEMRKSNLCAVISFSGLRFDVRLCFFRYSYVDFAIFLGIKQQQFFVSHSETIVARIKLIRTMDTLKWSCQYCELTKDGTN